MISSRHFLAIASLAVIGFVALAGCSSSTDQPGAAGDGTTPTSPPAGTGTPGGQPPSATTPPPATTPLDGGVGNPTNPAWGPTKCPALPAGKQVGLATGQQIAQLTVKDCDGNDYALENVCGADATWLSVSHGWCPYCRSSTQNSESILASYAGKNVAAVNVLVQNAQSQPPTMTDCKAWRDTYKLTNVIALYDPAGVTLGLFDAPSSALGVYLDKDRVIRSKTVHTSDTDLIKGGIDGALAP